MLACNLIQIVNFITWSRIVNGVQRESILDHVYTTDIMNIPKLHSITPVIGDHKMLIIYVNRSQANPSMQIKRIWRHHRADNLVHEIGGLNLDYNISNLQQFWNRLENIVPTFSLILQSIIVHI